MGSDISFSPFCPWGQEPGRCSSNICLVSKTWNGLNGQAFAYCLFVPGFGLSSVILRRHWVYELQYQI